MSQSTAATFAVSVCLAMAASTTFAAAQETNLQKLQWVPEVRIAINACMADQSRLCPDVLPGQGRLRCLAAQGGRLSQTCASAMQKASDALIAAGVTVNPGLISQ
jgi:hypothetical protein